MSSERSGSNLLRTLLSNHSDICAPPAPHLIVSFKNAIPYYGLLSSKDNAKKLFEDMIVIVNHRLHNWRLKIEFEEMYHKYRPKEFFDFFNLFYNEKTFLSNKKRFVCKENAIFNFAVEIIDYYKSAKFIYIYRDPRDYVNSWMNMPLGPNTPLDAASLWYHEQEKCNTLLETLDNKVFSVKYENLLKNTHKIITDLLLFLSEPVEDACFQVQPKNQDLLFSEYWKNLNNEIMRTNYKKYIGSFNINTINMIETVTKDYMIKLGYEFETNADWENSKNYMFKNKLKRIIRDFRDRLTNTETRRSITDRIVLRDALIKNRQENSEKILNNTKS